MKKIDFDFKIVAKVNNLRSHIEDDYWEEIVSEIILEKDIPTKVIIDNKWGPFSVHTFNTTHHSETIA